MNPEIGGTRFSISSQDLLVQCGQFGLGLPHADAGCKPPHHASKEVHAAALEQFSICQRPQRQPHIGCVSSLMADETLWGDTHDRAQHVAHAQRTAKHVRILLEAPDPELMADHRGTGFAARCPRALIVTLGQQPTE